MELIEWLLIIGFGFAPYALIVAEDKKRGRRL